jgi:hypothetical protein
MLRSPDFFSFLRGTLRQMGLVGWEEQAGLGVHFVGVSRFQIYPLRVQVQEHTEGTAAYIGRRVATLLLPGSFTTIRPKYDEEWKIFRESPDGKLVFISEWQRNTDGGVATLDVDNERILRTRPSRIDGRVVEQFKEVTGRFACVSVGRPYELGWRPRWLTMRQPKRQTLPPENTTELEP